MIKRRITGIVLAVALLVLGYVQGWPLRIAFAVFMALSIWEMYGAFIHKGAKPARWVGMIYAFLAIPVYMIQGWAGLAPLMTVSCILGMAAVIARGEVDFESLMASVFPLLYPGMMFSMLFPLQDLPGKAISTLALMLTFGVALLSDVMAYEVGTLWGKRRLCPNLSPKKSVEGSIAGLLTAVVTAVLCPVSVTLVTRYVPAAMSYYVELPPLWHFAVLGLIGGAASQFGDLAASMIKRYCGVKDFGSVFPGHGGMLDRIDSVLFNTVVVYMYFMLVVRI